STAMAAQASPVAQASPEAKAVQATAGQVASTSATTEAGDSLDALASSVINDPGSGGPDACTVTVNGQKKHGRWDSGGTSWCCIGATCYNCDFHTCTGGWNLTDPGRPPVEFEPVTP